MKWPDPALQGNYSSSSIIGPADPYGSDIPRASPRVASDYVSEKEIPKAGAKLHIDILIRRHAGRGGQRGEDGRSRINYEMPSDRQHPLVAGNKEN